MANKNPFYSRLEKIAKESNKLEDFQKGYESLNKDDKGKPQTEDVKELFKSLELIFPVIKGRKKMSDKEKLNASISRKLKEEKELKIKQEERDKEILLSIFYNGNDEEKATINKLINDYKRLEQISILEDEIERDKELLELKESQLKRLKGN